MRYFSRFFLTIILTVAFIAACKTSPPPVEEEIIIVEEVVILPEPEPEPVIPDPPAPEVEAPPPVVPLELGEHYFASGSWMIYDNRLYQNDAQARLAKMNMLVPQSGAMIYEFNARYEGGAEDGQGGFGLHIFAEGVTHIPSWGSGVSYLLWLNYDENPVSRDIPKGLSGQIYRSASNSSMTLLRSVDLNRYAHLLTDEYLANPVSFKIEADGDTGEVRIYDPTDPEKYYSFTMSRGDLPMRGSWVSLRTNGMRMSFAYD